MVSIALVLYVGFPLLIVTVIRRVPRLAGLNPIIPAYVVGLLLSVILPRTAELAAVQDTLSSVVVVLSIPLMLYSVDLR
jgi:Kef-type K+ transport system membrane component KefB